jgi:hypothetical protein
MVCNGAQCMTNGVMVAQLFLVESRLRSTRSWSAYYLLFFLFFLFLPPPPPPASFFLLEKSRKMKRDEMRIKNTILSG